MNFKFTFSVFFLYTTLYMIILATHKLYIVTNTVLKWVALFRHYKRPILVHF